ncbi:hypothetical protein EDB83DRAFT_2522463 [Lactarius deliciosus]|nr:hypothetical protein EDB83DRAFT_2522463 [Lactarius deliciosus]
MSPTVSESEALGLPSAGFGARHTSLPGFSEEGKTPRCGHTTSDDSFIRHDAYFFKDGNVTFLIGGTLYCVHRYFFSRDSVYFSTRFAQLGIRDHEALSTIISIGDIKRNDFEALLSVLYPTNFEGHELTYEQWKSVLHLSTRWGFASLRELTLKSIKPPTSHDKLVLARTYSINHWVLPALAALCERTLPLSLDEARQMRMEDVILVAAVREEIRGGTVRVDAVDIPRHVAAAQLAKPEGKAYSETRAQAEAEAQKAKLEIEAEAKANAEVKAKRETEAIVKRRTGAKAKRDPEAEAKEKAEAEVEAKREAEAKEKAEAEAMERHEADAKAKTEAEDWEKAKAEAREERDADAKAKAGADAKVAEEYKVKAAEEAKAAAARVELEAKQKAENERLEIEARSKAEAAKAKEKAEEVRSRVEVEKVRAKQAEEQIARQRAADKAARVAARAATTTNAPSTTGSPNSDPWSKIQARRPDGSSLWSKAASAIVPTEEPAPPPKSTNMWNSDPWSKYRNASSPSMKPGGES